MKKNSLYADRNVKRWNRPVFWHGEGILNKLKSPVKTGIHYFSCKKLFYDILIENNNSNITIFFFHANIERRGKELPFFMGNRVLSGKKVNRVFISDPSLLMSDNLSLAWYAGIHKGINIQDILLNTIKLILKELNSTKEIFFGPSNGGFAVISWL